MNNIDISKFKKLSENLKNKTFDSTLSKILIKSSIDDDLTEFEKKKIEESISIQNEVKLKLKSLSIEDADKAIFRLENNKVIRTSNDLIRFEKHALRLIDTPSANPTLIPFDTVLKGDRSPIAAINEYYNKYSLNQYGGDSLVTRIATELVYSVSPKFFFDENGNYNFDLIEQWVTVTMNYLEAEFPNDQLVWSILHISESSPHLHVLVVGRIHHNKWKKEIPSHSSLFGSRFKLRKLQTNYADILQKSGFVVSRGLEGYSAHHKEIDVWRAEQHARDLKLNEMEALLKDLLIKCKARDTFINNILYKYNIDTMNVDEELEIIEKELQDKFDIEKNIKQ